jgi:Domain of unknown function (DUF6362)
MTDWSPSLVEARLSEAAFVLKRLPEPRLLGYFSAWPEVTYSFADKVGQEPRRMSVLPSPQAISRMEETLTWTACLEPLDGKIVWMRAYGYRWREVCRAVGFQRASAHHHWVYGLCVIAHRLSNRGLNPRLSMQQVIDLARADDPVL